MSGYNVKELAEFIKREKNEKSPFVLFTGAGCSKSAGIPLASELVKEINNKYALDIKNLSEQDKSDYGRCMSELTKETRRTLLQGYIQKAKINWAHIAQASLLKEGYIQRVLTFNFDNILSRSCGLLGLYPSIYDFTSANLDLQHLIVDPAIVHLHGQSHGFIQLNTDEETKDHAERLSQFVASTLNQSPSIFIGYSGRADAFFPLLKSKYTGQERLFWIGREEEVPKHVNGLISQHRVAHYLHHKDADRFFIELAQELGCFPPKVFEDPFGHLLDELEPVLGFPIQEEHTKLDVLSSTKTALKEAQEKMKESKTKRPDFESLLMKGKYKEVIAESKTIELAEEEKYFVSWAYVEAGNRLFNEAKESNKTKLYEQVIEKYQQALQITPDNDNALYNWGVALGTLADTQNKLELYELAIEKYQQALDINPNRDDALYNWGIDLGTLAKIQNKPELYEQAIEKYQQALQINPNKDEALYNWGVVLGILAYIQDKPKLYELAIEKYQQALDINPNRDDALYNWGNNLGKLADTQNKPELYEHAIEKYQQAVQINPNKDEALYNWGVVLDTLADTQNKPELYEIAIEKYQQAVQINPNKDEALYNWGNDLGKLADTQNKPELYELAIEKYQQAVQINPNKDEALYNWGVVLETLADTQNKPELYEHAIEKYQQAVQINPNKDKALYNWGNVLVTLADTQNKPELYEHAIEKYQQALTIKPDNFKVLNNLGYNLIHLIKMRKNTDYLKGALSKYIKSVKLCGKPDYNLACLYALQEDEPSCKDELIACHKANTLPKKEHLNTDTDMDFVRNKEWFKELLDTLDSDDDQ